MACAPSTDDASSSTGSRLTGSPDDGFTATPSCWSPEDGNYYGEVDLRDRAHPRYRIRHQGLGVFGSDEGDRGQQNINLHFRDGTSWNSPDDLVAKFGRTYGPTIEADSDKTVAWSDLPVPSDVLDKAFSVKDGKYELETVEFVFNFKLAKDAKRACQSAFYPASAD
jgi:hypothetical protein